MPKGNGENPEGEFSWDVRLFGFLGIHISIGFWGELDVLVLFDVA